LATDRQTNGQTDGHHRCVKRLNKWTDIQVAGTYRCWRGRR